MEAQPSTEDLVERIRDILVWGQLSVEDLRAECNSRGLEWHSMPTAKGANAYQKAQAERTEKIEMVKALRLWQATVMFQRKGIPVKQVGQELAEALFRETERLEGLPLDALTAEYGQLGMPKESVDRKEMVRRVREVLIWSQFDVEKLKEECEDRELSTSGINAKKNAGREKTGTPGKAGA